MLCVHCSGGTHRQWTRLTDALEGTCRIVAPDLHGHGRTPAPDPIRLTFSHDVEMVKTLARAVEGPLHLVGHSYGGFVALTAAMELQEHLTSLTLIEPAAFHLLQDRLDRSAWEEINHVATRQQDQVEQGDLEGSATEFLAYWTGMSEEETRQQRSLPFIAQTMPSVASIWERLFRASYTLADYASLACPTLLVRGTATTQAAGGVAECLAEAMDRLQVVDIPGAGHMAPLTHPEPVIAALSAFVRRTTELPFEVRGYDA